MILTEFRIPIPVSLDELMLGQLYTIAEASKSETQKGEGVEFVTNEPYDDGQRQGQYTFKIHRFSSRVPSLLKLIIPNGALELHEKSWNAFPYCKTGNEGVDEIEMTNPWMKKGFSINIETLHVENQPILDNALNLNESQLKMRVIKNVDIANDHIDPKDYKESEDPSKVASVKTGRGPLGKDWIKNEAGYPMTIAYKALSIEFHWFGLQKAGESLIESIIHNVMSIFKDRIDKWFGLTLQDIRKIEEETKEALLKEFESKKLHKSNTSVDKSTREQKSNSSIHKSATAKY